MSNELIVGISIAFAIIAYWKSDWFISRSQKYRHSPFQILQIRLGIAVGVFIIVISIISKL